MDDKDKMEKERIIDRRKNQWFKKGVAVTAVVAGMGIASSPVNASNPDRFYPERNDTSGIPNVPENPEQENGPRSKAIPDADLTESEIASTDFDSESSTIIPEEGSQLSKMIESLSGEMDAANEKFGEGSVSLNVQAISPDSDRFGGAKGTAVPFLRVEGEGVSVFGAELAPGSIVFQNGEDEDGNATFGYIESGESPDGPTTPRVAPLDQTAVDYLESVGIEAHVGDWAAMITSTQEDGKIIILTISGTQEGDDVAFTIQPEGGKKIEAPATPEPKKVSKEETTSEPKTAEEAIAKMQAENPLMINGVYAGTEYPDNPHPVSLDSQIALTHSTLTIDGKNYPVNHGSKGFVDGIIPGDTSLPGMGIINTSGAYAGIIGQRTLTDVGMYNPDGSEVDGFHKDTVTVIDHLLVLNIKNKTYKIVFSTPLNTVKTQEGDNLVEKPSNDFFKNIKVGHQTGFVSYVVYGGQDTAVNYLPGLVGQYVSGMTPYDIEYMSLIEYTGITGGHLTAINRGEVDNSLPVYGGLVFDVEPVK